MEQRDRMHEIVGELVPPRAIGQQEVLPVFDGANPTRESMPDERGDVERLVHRADRTPVGSPA